MSLKLLIADDEDMIRRGVAKYLQLHSDRFTHIYEAENGQEAIDIILKYHPDMMLLDVQMPLKTGLDVMHEAERAGLRPVTIILSGYDEFLYAQQALKFGAKEYFLKPVRAADILACLNRLADDCVDAEQSENEAAPREQELPLVTAAREYIKEHYTEKISLTEVAEKLGISGGYLSTLFNQNMHCGFVDYLNEIRIDHACSYLEQNYLKNYEIAHKVGFQDEKYFTKVFKKIRGVTPKEYRNKIRGE
ncbi:MAG: response regulator [Clostridiales bacterium]|nr:response regulator [Clostridiales bacterium]